MLKRFGERIVEIVSVPEELTQESERFSGAVNRAKDSREPQRVKVAGKYLKVENDGAGVQVDGGTKIDSVLD